MQQIRHRLDNLADMLEDDFGPCPLGRPALLNWLQEQMERADRVPGAPASAVAAMIDGGYVRWLAELLEIDQPEAFGVDDKFDDEDPELVELFEGSELFPERDQPEDQQREGFDEESD